MELLFLLKAVVMGIVEGITEFLPVSSTGHLILFGNLINFNEPYGSDYAKMFLVVIQLGAILAIVVLYWDKIKRSVMDIGGYGMKLWSTILVAFIPAAVMGLLLKHKIEDNLMGPKTVVWALIVGALLMLFMEKKFRKNATTRKIEDVSYKQAVKIGLFQCLALWPGMSRSASTIMGGWIGGLDNVAASEFSFFLALPTMVAATGLDLIDAIKGHKVVFNPTTTIALIIGLIVAFLVALVVVDKFISFLKRKPMRIFAFYRLVVGVILLLLAVSKIITLNIQ